MALATFGSGAPRGLVVVPTLLAALFFGWRGAISGSSFTLLAAGTLHTIAGTDSFAMYQTVEGITNGMLLFAISMVASLVRGYDLVKRKSFEDETRESYELAAREVEERNAELQAVLTEFTTSVHSSLSVSDVSLCTVTHLSRALSPDFLALAVADLEAREIVVHQSIGIRVIGFNSGENRPVSSAEKDPASADEIRLCTAEELKTLGNRSQFAGSALEAGLQSVLGANFRNEEGELIAQVWLGSTRPDGFSESDVEFLRRISSGFKPAVVNARNAESLKQLQRYLVAQNELLTQMQDGIENAEGELRLNNLQLQELSDSKSQFVMEVTHEVKSPLAVMIGYADLLRFDMDLDESQREYAESIERAARQLGVLIDDLSDMSKVEAGRFTTTKEHHNVVKVVESVINGLKVSSPEYDRRLRLSDDVGEFVVEGDPARLGQVLSNLVSNALKYSADDQPVEVNVRSKHDEICISVSDRGLGISNSDVEKLFTPYFRTNNPEATKRSGTGLGLFLSKSIIEEHGGMMTVSSRLGLGSTFAIVLPALDEQLVKRAA